MRLRRGCVSVRAFRRFPAPMADTPPPLDLLCELSEQERLLADNPDAHGYLKLASGYAEAGWIKEATRAAERAKALAQGAGRKPVNEAVAFSGSCTPTVLIELLRSLHLTGKSGQLHLDALGGIRVVLTLKQGALIDAQSSDAGPGEPSLFRAGCLRAARYTFVPGDPAIAHASLPASTPDLLNALGARLQG